jgi:deoxyribonuclease-4
MTEKRKIIITPKNPAKIILIDLSLIAGSHIRFEKNMYNTVLSSLEYGMRCFQFFLGSPLTFNRKKLEYEDILKAKNLADEFEINVYSHAPYVFNLNGSTKCLCWKDEENGKILETIKNIEYELSILSNFKQNGVVVHPGSYIHRKKGMRTIAETINKIKFPENSMLLLENCAGEGNKIPRDFKEIKYILDAVESKKNIGICLDTAHIHGQGDYNLSGIEGIDKMFQDFEDIIGTEKLKLIHLNDSKVKLGAKKDAHELLMEGEIWKNDPDSLLYFIKICKNKEIPIILETHKNDMSKIRKIAMEI